MIRPLVVTLIVLGAMPAFADVTPTGRFRFLKPIEYAATKNDELVAVALDTDIYAAAGSENFRIYDDLQVETPFASGYEMERGTDRSRRFVETSVVSLKPAGQTLVVHVKLPAREPEDVVDGTDGSAEALVVATPLMNYERTVKVEGSTDGKEWKTLVPAAVLFDYSKYMDVSNREIALPKNDAREFKLTIDDLSDERISPLKELTRTFRQEKEDSRIEKTVVEKRPFRIDRISAAIPIVAKGERMKLATYQLADFKVREDAAGKRTIVDVRTRLQPLQEFVVETPDRNFSRHATVGHPDHPDLEVGRATLTRMTFREPHRDETKIPIRSATFSTFRITIANEDNPPLRITGVKGHGPIRRLLFLAEPGRQYRIEYGTETPLPAPHYETAALLHDSLRDATPTVAKLGAQVENTVIRPLPPAGSFLSNPWFLGGAIGVMVGVLGWCLMRAGKKLDALPKE
jgi:hypothetical protein